ncbi:MAG: O-antigen ligase family protein [Candidatus Levyibacteriota bacterium]
MQGIYLFWFLLLFSLLSAKSSLKNIPWIVYGLLLLIEFIVLFFLPLNESQRYVGTLGEPNALAAFIIFLWPFAFYAIKKFTIREKIGSSLILVIVVAILFLTASRSAAIAFALQILFISLTKYRFSLAKSVLVCVILYMISYAFPFFEHVPYENRGEVWKSALAAGSTHPLLGYGFGNTETALHATAVRLGLPIQYYYVDSAHNIFLDWWVQGGVIGVTLLLTLIYFTINEFIKHNKKREIVLLIGMITTLSFNPASVVGLFGFWWIIGQGLKK